MQVQKTRSGLFVFGTLSFLVGMILLTLNAEPVMEGLLGEDRVQRYQLRKTNNKSGILMLPDSISMPAADLALPIRDDLMLWLQAEHAIVVGNKGAAVMIPDLSGLENHAIQKVEKDAPKVIENAMNGRDVIRFNGKHTHYRFDSLGYGHPSYTFVVYQKPDTGGVSYQRIVSSGLDGEDYLTGGVSMFPASEGFGIGPIGPTIGVKNGKRLHDYRNFFIGFSNFARTKQNFVGDIAEVLVYKRFLTKEERRAVEAYLQQKYGIQPAL